MESITNNLQVIKLGLHIGQAIFIFVAFCIEIGYFTRATFTGASPGWYFGLCFLSTPVIIYQTMTARFPRSRKFANPYAFAILDLVYTVFWLSAFAAMAAWNSAALCIGACGLSQALVGLGFMIFLFFALTSAISVYGLIYFRNHATLPGARIPNNAAMIDPDHDAFSTAPHDEYAPVGMNDREDRDESHKYIGGGNTSELSAAQHYDSNSYGGGSYISPNVAESTYTAPHVSDDLSYSGGYTAPTDRVQFPAGNYHS